MGVGRVHPGARSWVPLVQRGSSLEEEGSIVNEGTDGGKKKRRRRKALLPEEEEGGDNQPQGISSTSPAQEANEGTDADTPATGRTMKELEERLRLDITRFRESELAAKKEEVPVEGLGALADKASSAFQQVLIADFFVVLGFLGW